MRRSTVLDLLINLIPGYVFLVVVAFFGFVSRGSLLLVTIGNFSILFVLTVVGAFLGFVLQGIYQSYFVRQDLPTLEAAEAQALKRELGSEIYAEHIASKNEPRYASFVIENVLARESHACVRNRLNTALKLSHAAGASITAILSATIFGMFLNFLWATELNRVAPGVFVALMWLTGCLLLVGSRNSLLDTRRVMTSVFIGTHRDEFAQYLTGETDSASHGRAKAVHESENGTFGTVLGSAKPTTLVKKAA